jgi:dTDP-4-amino-4,6-dideoxygalactose transaminase
MFAIKINNNKMSIDELNKCFANHNIEIRPFFYPYKQHKHLSNLPSHSNSNISNELNSNIIMLPSFPELNELQQKYIVDVIRLCLN